MGAIQSNRRPTGYGYARTGIRRNWLVDQETDIEKALDSAVPSSHHEEIGTGQDRGRDDIDPRVIELRAVFMGNEPGRGNAVNENLNVIINRAGDSDVGNVGGQLHRPTQDDLGIKRPSSVNGRLDCATSATAERA